MAFEFLQAFAKFFVDKSEWDKSIKGLVDDAEKGGKRAEDAFAKGFGRGLKSSGDAVEEIGTKIGKLVGIISSPWALAAAGAALFAKELIEVGRASIEFDREYTKVRVLLRGTPGELAEVRNQIGQVSGGLISGTEAIGVYRKALLDTGSKEAAAEIGRVAVELAKITDASPIQTVELLGSVLDATGKKFGDVENVAGKLFQLMQRGGGDVAQLSGQYLNLLDTADTLGISFEEVNAALIRLGEVAGSKPEKGMASLALAFAALLANSQKFREQGFDLEEVIKTDGLIGALRVLQAVTGGTRDGLRDVGLAGRNATTILKLLGDVAANTGTELREAIRLQREAGKSDVQAALAKRMGAASSELEKFQNQIKDLRAQAGTSLFDALGLTDDTPLAELESRLAGIIKLIEDAKVRATKVMADVGGMGSMRRVGGPAAVKDLAKLLRQRAMFEALIDDQKRSTEATDQDTAANARNSASAILVAAADQLKAAAKARLANAVELSVAALAGEAVQLQARALVDARERIATEARVRGEEALQAGVTRDQQRLQSTLTTTLAIAEAERSLDQARAQFEGRESAGLEDLLALRKRVAEEGAQAQIKADDKITESAIRAAQIRLDAMRDQAAEMAERPGFDANLDLRKQFEELHAQIAKSTDELDKLQKAAAVQRLVTEQKLQADLAKLRTDEFNARRAQVLEEQKLDDQRFAHRLAMGQVTIQEEIDRPRLLGMDPDRTAEERAKFAEQARSREKQAQQEMLDFLQAINRLTLQDAIATQQSITDSTKRGTQERLDAERKLADMIKGFRQQAAATAGTLFDLAASRVEKERNAALQAQIDQLRAPQENARRAALSPDDRRIEDLEKEKQKPVMLNDEQVKAEFAKARAEAMNAAMTWQAGGQVTSEQFKSMGSIAGINDQLSVFGGGLAGASVALEQFAQNLLKPFDQELKDRGIGQGGPNMLTPSASDSPEVADIKARAAAANARAIADSQEREPGTVEGLAGAREAFQRAYPASTGPDVSGAAERANAGMGTAEDAARRADEAAKQFQSGAMDGLKDAGASVDGTAIGRQIAVAIYRAVYDKLAVDIEREAARMV